MLTTSAMIVSKRAFGFIFQKSSNSSAPFVEQKKMVIFITLSSKFNASASEILLFDTQIRAQKWKG